MQDRFNPFKTPDRLKLRVYAPIQDVYGDVERMDFAASTITTTDGESFKLEEVDILQCTGLKDKNGKLIFEGDIIKDLSYSGNIIFLCAFVPILGGLGLVHPKDLECYNFCKENWTAYHINEEVRRLDNRFKLANRGNRLKCFSMGELKFDDYENIGNIYTNPELLEDKCQK